MHKPHLRCFVYGWMMTRKAEWSLDFLVAKRCVCNYDIQVIFLVMLKLKGLLSMFEELLASSLAFDVRTLLLKVTVSWTTLVSFRRLIAPSTINWALHRIPKFLQQLIIWQLLHPKKNWNNWKSHLGSIFDLTDSGMILLNEIACLQAMFWEILCIFFGRMEQWAQKSIFSWWPFKNNLALLVYWQMLWLGLASNLLANLPKQHM